MKVNVSKYVVICGFIFSGLSQWSCSPKPKLLSTEFGKDEQRIITALPLLEVLKATNGSDHIFPVGEKISLTFTPEDPILIHTNSLSEVGYFKRFQINIVERGEYTFCGHITMPYTLSMPKAAVVPKLYLYSGDTQLLSESEDKILEGSLGSKIMKGKLNTLYVELKKNMEPGNYVFVVAVDNRQTLDSSVLTDKSSMPMMGSSGRLMGFATMNLSIVPASMGKTRVVVKKVQN